MTYKPKILELAAGGTASNLADPNADKLMFWDDSAGAVDWLTAGSGLSISGTTITAASTTYAFSAYLASALTDATGDGTSVQLGSGTALTEFYDVGSWFNVNGTATAPVSGYYLFTYGALLQQTIATNGVTLILATTTTSYRFGNFSAIGASGNFPVGDTRLVFMTAGDTAVVTITVDTGTKTVDIYGAGSDPRTFFSGQLLAAS